VLIFSKGMLGYNTASCTNPTPIVDHERNCIILVFRTTDSRTDEEGILISAVFNQTDMMIESYDDGVTWSEPVSITESILKSEPRPVMFVPGPGHGIQLHSGRLIVPGHVFVKTDGGSKHYHNCSDQSTVLLSNDGGKNWSLGGRVPCVQDKLEQYIATNDAQALELTEDKVCLNSRTLSAYQSRAISCSDDGGLTFDKPSLKEALIEPGLYMRSGILRQAHFAGCQGSIVGFPAPREASQSKYNHDTWALFSNPASLHERKYMSIRLSRNGLWTWSGSWIIHKGPSGYSDMAYFETKGIPGASTIKTFAILYEKGRRNPYETIVFKTFTLDDVLHNIAL
uniref:Sialidase-4-like n=1 Tax=Saccoglossus kowalevskii TaxID=10224 RepID=A0ABM0LZD4_SACKO